MMMKMTLTIWTIFSTMETFFVTIGMISMRVLLSRQGLMMTWKIILATLNQNLLTVSIPAKTPLNQLRTLQIRKMSCHQHQMQKKRLKKVEMTVVSFIPLEALLKLVQQQLAEKIAQKGPTQPLLK